MFLLVELTTNLKRETQEFAPSEFGGFQVNAISFSIVFDWYAWDPSEDPCAFPEHCRTKAIIIPCAVKQEYAAEDPI